MQSVALLLVVPMYRGTLLIKVKSAFPMYGYSGNMLWLFWQYHVAMKLVYLICIYVLQYDGVSGKKAQYTDT